MTEPNSNQQALTAMSNAERLMLEAHQHFLSMVQAIEQAKQAVEEANASSINRGCPQYQMISAKFQDAFDGLKTGQYCLEYAFQNQIVKHLIQRGSLEQSGEPQQTEA